MWVLRILNWTLLLRRFFLWETIWTGGGVQDVPLNRCWLFGLSSIAFGVLWDTADCSLVMGFCKVGCSRLGENDRAGAGIWRSSARFRAQIRSRLRRNICRSSKTVLEWGTWEPVHHSTGFPLVYNVKTAKMKSMCFQRKKHHHNCRNVPELDNESSWFFKIHRYKFRRVCTGPLLRNVFVQWRILIKYQNTTSPASQRLHSFRLILGSDLESYSPLASLGFLRNMSISNSWLGFIHCYLSGTGDSPHRHAIIGLKYEPSSLHNEPNCLSGSDLLASFHLDHLPFTAAV